MRRAWLLLVLFAAGACGASPAYEPRDGDIVFHTSRSAQSLAIQKATGSRYSHMGVVYIQDGQPLVYEAVEPVKLTPLDEWTRRGESGHFVVKRLRDADTVLTEAALERMLQVGEAFDGKHYDLYFEWSDDRIYCSELVWKIFDRALGIDLGELETIRDFDLSDPIVRAKVQERWGGPPPDNETVISPVAIFDSDRLVTVYRR
ncbi:MAG: YiiX family permuted papain-like enzyme [Acidobacteria bacterium]|nr:YiiX family permuted papain-like enzyme [Acidobacteriota bacterium]